MVQASIVALDDNTQKHEYFSSLKNLQHGNIGYVKKET